VMRAQRRGQKQHCAQRRWQDEAGREHRCGGGQRRVRSIEAETPHPAVRTAARYGLRVRSPGASATSARRESLGPVQKFLVSGYFSEDESGPRGGHTLRKTPTDIYTPPSP